MTSLQTKKSQSSYQKWRSNLSRSVMVILSAISCQCGLAKPQLNLTPVVNPHSRHFIHLRGSVSKRIVPYFKIKALADYYTNNPDCETDTNIYAKLEGAPRVEQSKEIDYPITLTSSGTFNQTIPQDHFQAGVCQWQLGSVSYDFTYKKYNVPAGAYTSVGFSNSKKETQINRLESSWHCNATECHLHDFKNINKQFSLNSNNTFYLKVTGV